MTDDQLDNPEDEPSSGTLGPMPPPDDESSVGPFGALLPPEDRIWRHPSEVSGASGSPLEPAPAGPAWGTAAFSAVGGALAVGAIWLAMGNGDGQLVTERVSLVPMHTVTPRVVEADEWVTAVSATARDGTASVVSSSDDQAVAGAVTFRDDGYLLTSARAVEGLETLLVITADGTAHEASVVGADNQTDVSVLHVEQTTVTAVVSEGKPLEPGAKLAIIDPAGDSIEGTVTDTSAHTETSLGDSVIGVATLDVVLGDIPPGSPVVDDTGAVVGITTATDPTSTAAFVPIDIVRQVANDLIDDGVATHSWLGVTARDVTAAETEANMPPGALVTSLTSDGPAAAGGVMPGDVIIGVGTKPVESVSAMVTALRYHDPGDVVGIVVDRDGVPASFSIVLGALDVTSG